MHGKPSLDLMKNERDALRCRQLNTRFPAYALVRESSRIKGFKIHVHK